MLKLNNVVKIYSTKGGVTHRALNNISLSLEEKGLVFILGKSGCGKSTLLNIIGGLDKPTRGNVELYGKSLHSFSSLKMDYYRNTFIGFIFQEFNLINQLNVKENILLSLDLQGRKDEALLDEIMDKVGIKDLKDRDCYEISGGQRQRVSIARALIKDPSIILADEPTGSLDSKTSNEIISLLKTLSEERLVIVITHNKDLAYKYGDRIIEIKDGEIIKDITNKEDENALKRSTFISNNVIMIPKDGIIQQNDINKLNSILNDGECVDHFLSYETDKSKVKAFFPHLRETLNNKIDTEKYFQYEEKPSLHKELNFKKSTISLLRSIKFSYQNFRKHVSRLIFAILILSFSLLLTTLSSNYININYKERTVEALKKGKFDYIDVRSRNDNKKFTNEERNFFDDNYLCSYEYDQKLTLVEDNLDDVYMIDNNFNSIWEIKDFNNLDLKYNSDSIVNDRSVCIDLLFAREIAKARNISIEDLIGKDIKIQKGNLDFDLTIYGIVENKKLENYDIFKESNYKIKYSKEYKNYETEFYKNIAKLYVASETLDNLKDNYLLNDVYFKLVNKENKRVYQYDGYRNFADYSSYATSLYQNENGIYLSEDIISKYALGNGLDADPKVVIDHINSNLELAILNEYKYVYIADSSFVKGYHNVPDVSILVNESLFDQINDISLEADTIRVYFKNINVDEFVDFVYRFNYELNNEYLANFFTILDLFKYFLGSLFTSVNFILTIVAIILLFRFISSSIKDNTHQIGILKGIGASNFDIFKIYVVEAVLILISSIVLSTVIYFVALFVINYQRGIYYPILSYSFKIFFKVISRSLLVGLISIIIPLRTFMKIDPIEAINSES